MPRTECFRIPVYTPKAEVLNAEIDPVPSFARASYPRWMPLPFLIQLAGIARRKLAREAQEVEKRAPGQLVRGKDGRTAFAHGPSLTSSYRSLLCVVEFFLFIQDQ